MDGKVVTELAIPKGTMFMLNLRACNTNKALWGEDALEWKPERWLNPLPRAVEEAHIPGIYANLYAARIFSLCCMSYVICRMTFISGGNSCMYVVFSVLPRALVCSSETIPVASSSLSLK